MEHLRSEKYPVTCCISLNPSVASNACASTQDNDAFKWFRLQRLDLTVRLFETLNQCFCNHAVAQKR